MTSTLNIIIVNYRTPELTIGCLASLADEVPTMPGTRVWIVENGSGDDSAERISGAIQRRGWSGWAVVLSMTRNFGFAGGNNRGLGAAGIGRYALLLNSDTVVHAGCLRYCGDLMEREPRIGVMSCKLLNANGTVQNVARRFPTPMRVAAESLGLVFHVPRLFAWADIQDLTWDRATTARDVDWLGGAFLFIRGEMLARIGPLDESFFFYGEDIEFCHRVWRSGWCCRYDPAVTATHLGGCSSDPARLATQSRSAHTWRAKYRVQRLCYGRLAEAFVRTIDVLVIVVRLGWARIRGRGQEPQTRDWAATLRVITHRSEAAP